MLTVPLTMGAQGVIISNSLSTTTWAFTPNGLLVPVGGTSSITIPILNTGNEAATVTLVNLSPVFALSAIAAPGITSGGITTGTTTELTPTFRPTSSSTTSTDTGTVVVAPGAGSVFCEPLPPSWGTVNAPAQVNLSGSSAAGP